MIVAVVGGRDRDPSLAEIDLVAAEVQTAVVLRYSTATAPRRPGTERTIARYLKARDIVGIEGWPTRAAALLGDLARPPADLLIALAGGTDTRKAVALAKDRGVPTIEIEPVDEPRVWNRHHGEAPGPWMYIGRGTPLGNPHLDLEGYRRWLWAHIKPGSSNFDPAVVAALDALTPEHFAVCSCWPNPCHGEAVVRAWRWRNRAQAGAVSRA